MGRDRPTPIFFSEPPRCSTSTRAAFRASCCTPGDFVISADEKPSIQARAPIHEPLAPARGHGQRVEPTYKRRGALTYLAAWDVRRGHVFGRSEQKGGIAPFGRLVDQVMRKEPYASARTVYWIVDNGSSHRGQASIERLEGRWRNLRLIHLPVHASWLNQVEIYFSIVQRKLLQPNDFESTAELAQSLNEFERHYNTGRRPAERLRTRAVARSPRTRIESSLIRGRPTSWSPERSSATQSAPPARARAPRVKRSSQRPARIPLSSRAIVSATPCGAPAMGFGAGSEPDEQPARTAALTSPDSARLTPATIMAQWRARLAIP